MQYRVEFLREVDSARQAKFRMSKIFDIGIGRKTAMRNLICIALLLLIISCKVEFNGELFPEFRENTFVVPDGCRGVLNLVVVDGLPPGYEDDGERILYHFTTSGLLYSGDVRDLQNTWDQTTARFVNGTEIAKVEFRWEDPNFEGERFGLIGQTGSGWSTNPKGAIYQYRNNEIWAVIGNSSEFVDAYKQMHSGKPRSENQFVCENR